jgi:hypothetical protein
MTFTTTAIVRQQLMVVWRLLLKTGAEGSFSFISGTASRSASRVLDTTTPDGLQH